MTQHALSIAHNNEHLTERLGTSMSSDEKNIDPIKSAVMDAELKQEQVEYAPETKKKFNVVKFLIVFSTLSVIIFIVVVGGVMFFDGTFDEKPESLKQMSKAELSAKVNQKSLDSPFSEEELSPTDSNFEAKSLLEPEVVKPPVVAGFNYQVKTGDDIQLPQSIDEFSPGMREALYGPDSDQSDSTEVTAGNMIESESQATQDNQLGTIASNPSLESLISTSTETTQNVKSLQENFVALKKQTDLNSQKLIANQNAITQTAQLIVAMKDIIQKTKVDVVQLRSVAFDNQDNIKEIENKLKKLQYSIATNGSVQPQVKNDLVKKPEINSAVESVIVDIQPRSESVVDPFVAQKNGQALKPHVPVYPNSGVPKSMVESKTKVVQQATVQKPISNVMVLDKLWVMAVHADKAVVYDDAKNQYLLRAGASYKNLGVITSVDSVDGKVYGKTESGTAWVIAKR